MFGLLYTLFLVPTVSFIIKIFTRHHGTGLYSPYVALLFISFISAGVYFCLKDILEKQKWPSTQGTVLNSTLKTEKGEGKISSYTFLVVKLSLKYFVNNKEYVKKIKSGYFSSQSSAENEFSKFQSGASVLVYYNPRNPEETFIQKEKLQGVFIFLILWWFLIISMFFMKKFL